MDKSGEVSLRLLWHVFGTSKLWQQRRHVGEVCVMCVDIGRVHARVCDGFWLHQMGMRIEWGADVLLGLSCQALSVHTERATHRHVPVGRVLHMCLCVHPACTFV
jgi:hypothetical protein